MTTTRSLLALFACALVALAAPRSSSAAAMDEIATANQEGKVVFLVLTDATGANLQMARDVAKTAQSKTPDSTIVELNRSDPAQAAAVKNYRVAGAPVPLVLVIGQNGVAAGASLVKKGAVERLVKLVPTPGKSEYLKVLSQNQTAVVVFSHAKMPQQSPLFEQISAVVQQTKGKVVPVLVDVSDTKEQKFMAEWKVNPKSTQPTVIVMNPKGLTLGRMDGAPTAAQIIETTKKRPCCGDPGCSGCK
jgi:ActR/RegA family two-component response regulator